MTDDLIARARAALDGVTPGQTDKIIPEADVIRIHGYANFGAMTPREVIADGVLKYAYGYQSGHTQLMILLEHRLVRKPKPGSYRSTLTKRGQAYFRAAWPYKQIAADRSLVPDMADEIARLRAEVERLRMIIAARTAKINWRDDPDAIVEDDEPQIGRDYA
jgi:hypothetical protein